MRLGPGHLEARSRKPHAAHRAQAPHALLQRVGRTGRDNQRLMPTPGKRRVQRIHVPLHPAVAVRIIGADLNNSHGEGQPALDWVFIDLEAS